MPHTTLNIQLKRLGKKNIQTIDYAITDYPNSLRQLIEICVKSELKKYNDKRTNNHLINFLSTEAIQHQCKLGKIDFGYIKNNTTAVLEQSLDNALQGYEDGLYLVFIDGEEIDELDQQIDINKASVVAFLRMTFLTGTYW